MNAALSVYCIGEVGIDPGWLGGQRRPVHRADRSAGGGQRCRRPGAVDCFVVDGGVADLDALVTGIRVADCQVPVVVVTERTMDALPEEVTDAVAPEPTVDAVDRLREVVLSVVTDYWRPDELAIRDRALDAAPIGVTISDPSRPDNPMM